MTSDLCDGGSKTEIEPGGGVRATLDVESVRTALGRVAYPGLTRDLVSFGMVKHIAVSGDEVRVQLALRTEDASVPALLRASVAESLRSLGATTIVVEIVKPEPAPRTLPQLPHTSAPRPGAPDPWAERVRLGRVKHVVAVGAGKGGVGKSTVAVNLALALRRGGLSVGLLDADIYGPSVPILLGIEEAKHHVRMTPEKHIIPVIAHDLAIISFGFFLGEGSPAIWRGPMVSKAVKQFARGVEWPELDVLVVDLPPGTGDIPLSLAQSVELSGAIVVTQPPRLAGVEARKAGAMFATLGVPVLGVVENMTGAFGAGGGIEVARALNAPLLGSIPFDSEVVGEGDAGTPTLTTRSESAFSRAFDTIASSLALALGWSEAHAGAQT
jgi:ATP-binding protein involved in chromosome partitioning